MSIQVSNLRKEDEQGCLHLPCLTCGNCRSRYTLDQILFLRPVDEEGGGKRVEIEISELFGKKSFFGGTILPNGFYTQIQKNEIGMELAVY